MLDFDLPRVPPTQRSRADLVVQDPLDLSFEGFGEEAFAILDRLKAHPHIDQYREEKPGLHTHLKDPFKRYRNDLVVNWVLPSRLDLETERNVFSRLLKNDFGAGGCHHHLWMAFYRPEYRRITDAQIAHSLSPEGLTVGLYIGDHMKDVFPEAQARIAAQPQAYLDLVNPLLQNKKWRLETYRGSGKSKERATYDAPLDAVPEDVPRARGIWMRTLLAREDVLRWEGRLVENALDAVFALWPLYRFLA